MSDGGAADVGALAVWWRGARPRTLGAGLVPVVLGTAAAGEVIWWRFAAALVVGAGLQVGVNYANDYFDGVRGVDTAERLGPAAAHGERCGVAARGARRRARRARASRRWPASRSRSRPRRCSILVVGALALVAALLYSGGPRPYAGLGLGELMVFVFFGLMATCGTAFVMVETVPADGVVGRRGARLARRGDPRREQPARHPHRRGRRQADARRAASATARPARLYRATCVAAFAAIALGVLVDIAVDGRGPAAVGAVRARRVGARDPADGGRGLGDRTRPDPRAHRHGRHARRLGLLTALGLVLAHGGHRATP